MTKANTLPFPYLSYLVIIFLISRLMSIIGLNQNPWSESIPSDLFLLDIASKISLNKSSLAIASTDFGNLIHKIPAAVFHPTSIGDIVSLVNFSYNHPKSFKIGARGRGHSCRGQAMVENGIVIDMPSLSHNNNNFNKHYINYGNGYTYDYNINNKNDNRIRVSYDPLLGFYGDVGGEQLWIDVLQKTLEYGVAPVSWTDYLYLSVGGTLSNAGISGQAFRYGPQISNVYEMDVITGKGELITCSRKKNSDLFYGVLGGLGQFGIITRARIKLEAAPKKVKWVRMLYNSFSTFTKDQEHLISRYGNYQQELVNIKDGVDYVEGSLIMHQVDPNNWRSSFFSSNDQIKIASLDAPDGIIYFLEVAKYIYDQDDEVTVNKDLEMQLKGLNYIPGCIFTREVTFYEFLNRVRKGELELQSKGQWEVPHPWLNVFFPKSQIENLYHVFTDIIAKDSKEFTGPILIYPLNRNKWDDKMSAIIPEEEDIFYTLGLLHSSGLNDWEIFERKNEEILRYCNENGIKIKQYLPHYSTKEEWKNHFGSKWKIFQQRKTSYDPNLILSPGQNIFNFMCER